MSDKPSVVKEEGVSSFILEMEEEILEQARLEAEEEPEVYRPTPMVIEEVPRVDVVTPASRSVLYITPQQLAMIDWAVQNVAPIARMMGFHTWPPSFQSTLTTAVVMEELPPPPNMATFPDINDGMRQRVEANSEVPSETATLVAHDRPAEYANESVSGVAMMVDEPGEYLDLRTPSPIKTDPEIRPHSEDSEDSSSSPVRRSWKDPAPTYHPGWLPIETRRLTGPGATPPSPLPSGSGVGSTNSRKRGRSISRPSGRERIRTRRGPKGTNGLPRKTT